MRAGELWLFVALLALSLLWHWSYWGQTYWLRALHLIVQMARKQFDTTWVGRCHSVSELLCHAPTDGGRGVKERLPHRDPIVSIKSVRRFENFCLFCLFLHFEIIKGCEKIIRKTTSAEMLSDDRREREILPCGMKISFWKTNRWCFSAFQGHYTWSRFQWLIEMSMLPKNKNKKGKCHKKTAELWNIM